MSDQGIKNYKTRDALAHARSATTQRLRAGRPPSLVLFSLDAVQRTTLLLLSFLAGACLAHAKIYTPEGGVRPSKGKVDIELIELVTDQDVIGRNISIPELTAFIKRAEKRRSQRPAECRSVSPARARDVLTSRETDVPFEIRPNHPPRSPSAIYDSLQKLPDIRTKKDSISFKIDFVIKAKG